MFCGNLGNTVNRKDLGRKSFRQGFWGELKALFYIIFKGYIPLKWRYKNRHGEIDLIAKKKNILIFIEVKTRPTMELGYDAISALQKQRIENAAHLFVRKHKKYRNYGLRFDGIIITPKKWPIHMINIW